MNMDNCKWVVLIAVIQLACSETKVSLFIPSYLFLIIDGIFEEEIYLMILTLLHNTKISGISICLGIFV